MTQQNRKTLLAFQAAWVSKDIGAMLELFTDDIKYHASVGPEPGQTWTGKGMVQKGILQMLAHDENMTVVSREPLFFGDQAFCGWIYVGETREVGCDLFTFRAGKIAVKDAYRKCRG